MNKFFTCNYNTHMSWLHTQEWKITQVPHKELDRRWNKTHTSPKDEKNQHQQMAYKPSNIDKRLTSQREDQSWYLARMKCLTSNQSQSIYSLSINQHDNQIKIMRTVGKRHYMDSWLLSLMATTFIPHIRRTWCVSTGSQSEECCGPVNKNRACSKVRQIGSDLSEEVSWWSVDLGKSRGLPWVIDSKDLASSDRWGKRYEYLSTRFLSDSVNRGRTDWQNIRLFSGCVTDGGKGYEGINYVWLTWLLTSTSICLIRITWCARIQSTDQSLWKDWLFQVLTWKVMKSLVQIYMHDGFSCELCCKCWWCANKSRRAEWKQ